MVKKNISRAIILIMTSFIIGTAYYKMMSASIPKEVNCSFSANIWTDIFAFIAGFILLYLGVFKYNDSMIIIIGSVIITEHIWQLIHNKIKK